MVSNLGRIKTLFNNRDLILKPYKNKNGYLTIKINKTRRVNQIVAMTFIPNPNNYKIVNHINGIKDDNRVENLEWCSSKQNTIHYIQNLETNIKRGILHHKTTLTEKDVINIFIDDNLYKNIALKYNVSIGVITKIKNSICWKHVTENL